MKKEVLLKVTIAFDEEQAASDNKLWEECLDELLLDFKYGHAGAAYEHLSIQKIEHATIQRPRKSARV